MSPVALGPWLSDQSDGTLIEIRFEYDLITDRAIFVMYPEKRHLPLKVRKFIDHLSARLSVMKNN